MSTLVTTSYAVPSRQGDVPYRFEDNDSLNLGSIRFESKTDSDDFNGQGISHSTRRSHDSSIVTIVIILKRIAAACRVHSFFFVLSIPSGTHDPGCISSPEVKDGFAISNFNFFTALANAVSSQKLSSCYFALKSMMCSST